MSAGHTPGPWKLDVRMSTQGFWRVYGRLSDGTPEYHVATVHDANDRPQNDANARLIAAAPELLEAVTDAHKLLGSLTGNDIRNATARDRTMAAYAHLSAAIAKVQP